MKMFNVPNIITAGNLLCGIFAIILAMAGRIDIAPFFIFGAAILDFFDGFAARLLKQHSELGKQLDSLADMVSFGLAPGIIMLITLVMNIPSYVSNPLLPGYTGIFIFYENLSGYIFHPTLSKSWVFIPLLIPVFSMFRLAKFNIDTRQSDSFIGLPTPANTLFFLTFPLILSSDLDVSSWQFQFAKQLIQPAVMIPLICIMCYLLIAEIPLFALKFKSFGWKGNEIRYTFLITCGILIFTIGWWSLAIIILLYLIVSIINNILRKKTNA